MATYTKDAQGNEVYEKDVNGNEVVAHARYAKNNQGVSLYPKDANGNECIDAALGLIQRNGEYVLPVNSLGLPFYEKNALGEDTYTLKDGKYIIGRSLNGNQYYAKKNGNEFYPPDNTAASKITGKIYYATDANGQTVFPKDGNNNELYLMNVIWSESRTIPTKYAKDKDANEIYPVTATVDQFKSEIILTDQYAKDKNGDTFYPKDAFNNEFYLPEKDITNAARADADFLTSGANKRYAVTNDNKIILPSVANQPKIITAQAPALTNANVVGRMIRETNRASGFLTNQTLTVTPARDPKIYSYVDLQQNVIKVTPPGGKAPTPITFTTQTVPVVAPGSAQIITPFHKTWYFWVVLIVSLIIKALAVWWFFLRNRGGYTRI